MVHNLICKQCSSSFQAGRKDAKYCSQLCVSRARPKRTYDPKKRSEWYRSYRSDPKNVQKLRDSANQRAKKVREWLNEYKLKVGCTDCGYNASPHALDFDHVTDVKNINVCNAKSISAAKKEIELCEVRCSNCHRVLTHKRYHSTDS